jgi:Helicase HerA, central domain
MVDYEKLGVFYLGKNYDPSKKSLTEDLLLYPSKDLTTHAVCVGMTGSGKTGLCISLLEEAVIDNIPALVIDPKGDITNLLLTFPDLKPEDFLPWINKSDAERKNMSEIDFAKSQADLWRNGLQDWGQDPSRISKLKSSAEFEIYTPGSSAAKQISILNSFDAPDESLLDDPDMLNEKITTTTSGILGLLGIDADPIKSREHILISNIFQFYWSSKQNLDLASLIQSVQNPPMKKVGVFDADAFYPQKERFELAMLLNNILSAPTFQSWLTGESLSIDKLLFTGSGKPKVSIMYTAHLTDSERMFFTTLFLNQLLSWMRKQSGTTSLRALLYVDEIFGYIPPVANPPSKKVFLTLLKQARAFGLGLVLATQNPVDLDYKSLSNAGTWFIGRLQTEKDIERLIDGLESATSSNGKSFDRKTISDIISNLDKRVFLLNDVNQDNIQIFQTRWAMSYLRGPLTKSELKLLVPDENVTPLQQVTKEEVKPITNTVPVNTQMPVLPGNISPNFLQRNIQNTDETTYLPYIIGKTQILFSDRKSKIDVDKESMFLAPVSDEAIPVNWESSFEIDLNLGQLSNGAMNNIKYSDLPDAAKDSKNYTSWEKDLKDFLYNNYNLELFQSKILNEQSKPGETERDFRIRLNQLSRETKDEQVQKLKDKYQTKLTAIENKIKTAEDKVVKEQAQSSQQTLQTAISAGATILGALLGRKTFSSSTLSKAGTTMRSASKIMKGKQDVALSKENLEMLKGQLADLEKELQSETDGLTEKYDVSLEEFEKIKIRPQKTNIFVKYFNLVWIPVGNESVKDISEITFI